MKKNKQTETRFQQAVWLFEYSNFAFNQRKVTQLPTREKSRGKRGETEQKGSTDLFQYLQGFPTSPYCSALNLDLSRKKNKTYRSKENFTI